MRNLFLTLALILPLGANASLQPVDRQGRPAADSAHASFMRMHHENGYYRDFALDESLHREGWIIAGKPEGTHTYYHTNGRRKGVKHYENGIKTGLWQWWYPHGQLKEQGYWEQFVDDTGRPGERFVIDGFWGRDGSQWLKQGTGRYEAHSDDGKRTQSGEFLNSLRHGQWVNYHPDGSIQSQEQYLNGELVEGISYVDAKTFTYNAIRTQPQPPQEWQSYLDSHMSEQPSDIRVRFSVSERGQLSDITLLTETENYKHIIKVLQDSPEWTPATLRGVPVSQHRALTLTL